MNQLKLHLIREILESHNWRQLQCKNSFCHGFQYPLNHPRLLIDSIQLTKFALASKETFNAVLWHIRHNYTIVTAEDNKFTLSNRSGDQMEFLKSMHIPYILRYAGIHCTSITKYEFEEWHAPFVAGIEFNQVISSLSACRDVRLFKKFAVNHTIFPELHFHILEYPPEFSPFFLLRSKIVKKMNVIIDDVRNHRLFRELNQLNIENLIILASNRPLRDNIFCHWKSKTLNFKTLEIHCDICVNAMLKMLKAYYFREIQFTQVLLKRTLTRLSIESTVNELMNVKNFIWNTILMYPGLVVDIRCFLQNTKNFATDEMFAMCVEMLTPDFQVTRELFEVHCHYEIVKNTKKLLIHACFLTL